MNERIDQLIQQCTTQQFSDCVGGYEIFDKEKFAQMIVEECIEQIQLSTARDPRDTPQYRQSVGHVHRIRQHFGLR